MACDAGLLADGCKRIFEVRTSSGKYGIRQKISILSVSCVLGHGRFDRGFHKELTHNCMEQYVGSWNLSIQSGRRLRSGQNWRCRFGRRCNGDVREANKARCVDRQELFLYLTSQLLQDKHTWTYRSGLQERDVWVLHSWAHLVRVIDCSSVPLKMAWRCSGDPHSIATWWTGV